MNHDVYQITEWPKYFSTNCPHCREWVPMGHAHYCDPPKEPTHAR